MPQYGVNSAQRARFRLGAEDAAVAAPDLTSTAIQGLTLYPSGTDFRTRMPTFSRDDWMGAGNAGYKLDCRYSESGVNEVS